MCWAASGLILACVGYLPSAGSTVTLKRACVSGYSKDVRAAAVGCARKHKIEYRIED